jgi:Flp pilus assembly protein TadG
MRGRRKSCTGNAMVEFTLVAIPLIFVVISIVELSRGMWIYTTLAHAVKTGARYAAVHGNGCVSASSSCAATIANVAQTIADDSMGLAGQMTVVMQTPHSSQTCNPISSCTANAGAWPPSGDNDVGTILTISGSYNFTSALAMFWPGAAKTGSSSMNLGATASETVAF